MLGDGPEKSKNPLKKAMRRRNAKMVQFTASTYHEASEVDWSDSDDGFPEARSVQIDGAEHRGAGLVDDDIGEYQSSSGGTTDPANNLTDEDIGDGSKVEQQGEPPFFEKRVCYTETLCKIFHRGYRGMEFCATRTRSSRTTLLSQRKYLSHPVFSKMTLLALAHQDRSIV